MFLYAADSNFEYHEGPGSPAYLYVKKSLQKRLQVPIQGWFAQKDQFEMGPNFIKSENIRGFQIASPSIMGLRCVNVATLLMAAVARSLSQS